MDQTLGQKDLELVKKITSYWFVDSTWDRVQQPTPEHNGAMMRIHWKGLPEVDQEISDLFKEHVDSIHQGEKKNWFTAGDKESTLAYILLADQFSRSIYRGKPEAF